MIKFLIVLLFTITSADAFSQLKSGDIVGGDNSFLEPKKYTIASTQVLGVDNLDHDAIRIVSGLTVGKQITIPGQDISKAIETLWAQNLFSDVQIGYDKIYKDEIFLVIKLVGRPKLNGYKFAGIRKGEEDNLKEIIDLTPGQTITESLLTNTRNIIKGYYNDKGFYNSKIDIAEKIDTSGFNLRNLVITIDKGERVKIGVINVYDNEVVSTNPDDKLIKRYKTKISYSDGGIRRSMKDTKQKGIMRIFKR